MLSGDDIKTFVRILSDHDLMPDFRDDKCGFCFTFQSEPFFVIKEEVLAWPPEKAAMWCVQRALDWVNSEHGSWSIRTMPVKIRRAFSGLLL